MVPAHRRHAGLQLRVERMYGDHLGALVLQVSAGLGFTALLGGESSGEALAAYITDDTHFDDT